jgi:hypothetical protein
MVTLNYKESKRFLKRIKEDLKHPVGPVPTPKLKYAIKMIEEEMITIVPCKKCHEHPCTCKGKNDERKI